MEKTEKNAFKEIENSHAIRETLLDFPNFNIPFRVHTEESKTGSGKVICQEEKHIAFYSLKLNSA